MTSYIMQHTLDQTVTLTGTGVHSGKQITITIKPAPANHGIKFQRIDLPGTQPIQALFKHVVDTSLATVLGNNGAIVSTIEHLMASFAGFGIDNALVEMDEYEMPVMDGSAKDFARMLNQAGLAAQELPRQFIQVRDKIRVEDQEKFVEVVPCDRLKITSIVDFDHPLIGEQTIEYEYGKTDFVADVAPARTFGFLKDIELLKKFSLGKGGGLDTAIVIDKDKVLNEDGFRFPDEIVRHKLLDSLGDFSLLGMPIVGHITTYKSGHALNHKFIENFLDHKHAWETGSLPRTA